MSIDNVPVTRVSSPPPSANLSIDQSHEPPDWPEISADAQTPTNTPQNPPESTISPPPLKPRQLAAIEMIVRGLSSAHICRTLRLDRGTLRHWRNHNREFVWRLHIRQEEVWNQANDHFRKLIVKTAQVLEEQLTSPDENTRFRAPPTHSSISARFDPNPGKMSI